MSTIDRTQAGKSPVVAMILVVAAIASFVAWVLSLQSLGESSCDIYCGPVSGFSAALLLAPVTVGLWLAGVVAASLAVGLSRARSRLGWAALAASIVIPVVALVAAWNSGVFSL